jgi:hypothetical protein
MYMGARKQKCMWVQDNRDVCGSKTTNMYVGAGTTKMSKQDKLSPSMQLKMLSLSEHVT